MTGRQEKGGSGMKPTLEVGQVALLVEAGGAETERVHDVVHGLLAILELLTSLLGGSVGADICIQSAPGQHCARG